MGKLEGLRPNIWIYNKKDIAVGTIVFLGVDEEGSDIELNDIQIDIVMKYITKNIMTARDLLKLICG